jgi:hypothetical protein
MEKEIKEDFTIGWLPLYILTAFVVISALFAGAVSFFRLHDWHTLAFLVCFSVFTIWFVRFCVRMSLERVKANPRKWLLTNEGLVRLYGSGERETIRWEQIRDMRWGRHVGLKIKWEEPRHDNRVQEFQDEFRKPQTGRYLCWIRVREAEARELFQCAKREWVDMKL